MRHGMKQHKHMDSQAIRSVSCWVGAGLILVMALSANMRVSHAWAADPPLTPNPAVTPLPGWDPTTVQKVVLVRTRDGQPVPDLEVNLAPAPLILGGPPSGTGRQHGRTDAQGMVRFTGLG